MQLNNLLYLILEVVAQITQPSESNESYEQGMTFSNYAQNF